MKNEPQEQKLLNFARQTLDNSIQTLDSHTLSRLQSARQITLSQPARSHPWWVQPAWAMTTACLVIVLFALWNINSQPVKTSLPFEDVEILASTDGWEFYEDLEFYAWLAEDDQTG